MIQALSKHIEQLVALPDDRTQSSVKSGAVPLVVAIMSGSCLHISHKSAGRVVVPLRCFYEHVVSWV